MVVVSGLVSVKLPWFSLAPLKLCYFLAQNQIKAEAFSTGELILTEGRERLLDTGCFTWKPFHRLPVRDGKNPQIYFDELSLLPRLI